MSIRNFIGASSALLLAWLGATFFHETPAERYPKQGPANTAGTTKTSSNGDTLVAKAETAGGNNR